MVIAVTGGTGFVGRHVLALLAGQGAAVRALARTPAALPKQAGVEAVQGDLTDPAALAALCEGAEGVLHIAGAISGGAAHMQRVNAEGTATLLAAAGKAGVKRFVHVSSLAAREPELSPYARSKAAGEAAVRAATRTLSTLIIRPPAVYGEGDRATLPLLRALTSRTALLPGLKQSRFSLIHAEDLARICIASLECPVSGVREVDDGHGAYTWPDVAGILQQMCGRPQRLHFLPLMVATAVGHAADGLAALTGKPGMVSAGKIRELYHADWVSRPPGWPRPDAIPLHTGMHRTLAWAMAQGLLPQLPLADRSPAP
jgi:nucleoside-diphosphate-sugar epimerase